MPRHPITVATSCSTALNRRVVTASGRMTIPRTSPAPTATSGNIMTHRFWYGAAGTGDMVGDYPTGRPADRPWEEAAAPAAVGARPADAACSRSSRLVARRGPGGD